MLDTLTEIINELKDQGLTTNEAINVIEEAIKEIEDVNLEKVLDEECDRYNKFTESNPAEHIRYDKNGNRFILEHNELKIKKKKID